MKKQRGGDYLEYEINTGVNRRITIRMPAAFMY